MPKFAIFRGKFANGRNSRKIWQIFFKSKSDNQLIPYQLTKFWAPTSNETRAVAGQRSSPELGFANELKCFSEQKLKEEKSPDHEI